MYTKEIREGIVSKYDHYSLPKDMYSVVSIMRAADSMINSDPILEDDNFSVGKILIQRDEESLSKEPKVFYSKLPKNIE